MKKLILILAAALLQGCAFTDATLHVGMPIDASVKGPLSAAPSTEFKVTTITDARQDQQRIGYKKNGFGQNTADIVTSIAVTDIIANAVKTGLKQNGHTVDGPAQVNISGAVSRFWFEFDPNMFTVEFIGNINCDLEFVDAKNGKQIYKSTYNGTFSKKVVGGLEATWTDVMNQAVVKLVDDMVYDENLQEALIAYTAVGN